MNIAQWITFKLIKILFILIKFVHWIYIIEWNFFKIFFYLVFFRFFFFCQLLFSFLNISLQFLLLFFKTLLTLLNKKKFLIRKIPNNFLFPIIYLNLCVKHIWPIFPIFNYTKFRFTYEKKEKQPFLIVENYGNVSSIKYDLSEYPLREFKIFKIKIKPLLDKLDNISLEPIILFLNEFFKILYFDINPLFWEKVSNKNLLIVRTFWLYIFTSINNIYLLNILTNFNKYIKYTNLLNFFWIFYQYYTTLVVLEKFFLRIIKFCFVYSTILIWFMLNIFYWFWFFFVLYLEKNNLLLTDKKIRKTFLFFLKIKNMIKFFYSRSITLLLLVWRVFTFYCLFILEQLFPTFIYFIRKGELKIFFKILRLPTFTLPKIFKNYINFGWKFF